MNTKTFKTCKEIGKKTSSNYSDKESIKHNKNMDITKSKIATRVLFQFLTSKNTEIYF